MALAVILGKSADLAKAEPQRMVGAEIVGHVGMAGVQAGRRPACAGSSVQSQSE